MFFSLSPSLSLSVFKRQPINFLYTRRVVITTVLSLHFKCVLLSFSRCCNRTIQKQLFNTNKKESLNRIVIACAFLAFKLMILFDDYHWSFCFKHRLVGFFFFSYFTFVSPFSLLPHLTVERKNVIIAHLAQSKTHAPFWMLNVKRKRTSLFFYLWHLLRMAWCQAFEKERSWMVVFSGLIHVASADIEVASESL